MFLCSKTGSGSPWLSLWISGTSLHPAIPLLSCAYLMPLNCVLQPLHSRTSPQCFADSRVLFWCHVTVFISVNNDVIHCLTIKKLPQKCICNKLTWAVVQCEINYLKIENTLFLLLLWLQQSSHLL
jgi:hypothetical protein